MSNANTPAMMAQSMAESLLRENKDLKEQNALLTVQVQEANARASALDEIKTLVTQFTQERWHSAFAREWADRAASDYCRKFEKRLSDLAALPQQVKSEDARSARSIKCNHA